MPEPREGFDPGELAPWEGSRLLTIPAAEVLPTRPEWIVEGWLLRRALNLIVGRQGAGKTSFAAWVVSVATTDNVFPGDEARAPLRAAVLSLEEPKDRVVARLKAAGADLERVTILDEVEDTGEDGRRFLRRWQIPRDISALGEAISAHGIDVVIIDGLGFSIAGDSHNYATVGSALSSLAAEADRTGSAIICLTHPPKGASDPVTAAIGSTAWTSIPRISIVLGIDPNDENRRVTRVAKTNYREPDAGLNFTLASDEEFEVGFVANLRFSDVSKETDHGRFGQSGEKGERADARQLLLDELAGGPQPSDEVMKAAEANGISRSTMFRARKEEKIRATRSVDPKTGRSSRWMLCLPDSTVSSAPDGSTPDSGHTGVDQELQFAGGPECQPLEFGTVEGRPFYARDEY